MTKIEFTGWVPGVKKISATHLIKENCRLTLGTAHNLVNQILETNPLVHSFRYCRNPVIFVKDLNSLGIKARLL